VSAQIIELDAREFEAPMPLMKTLEAVATLPPGAELRVHAPFRGSAITRSRNSRCFQLLRS